MIFAMKKQQLNTIYLGQIFNLVFFSEQFDYGTAPEYTFTDNFRNYGKCGYFATTNLNNVR